MNTFSARGKITLTTSVPFFHSDYVSCLLVCTHKNISSCEFFVGFFKSDAPANSHYMFIIVHRLIRREKKENVGSESKRVEQK